jgi:hypothetical protein
MTGQIFRIRWRPVTWGVLAVAVFSLAMMTVYGLEPRYARYVAGGLLITCLAAWVAAFFLGGQDHDRDQLDAPFRVPTHIQRPGL